MEKIIRKAYDIKKGLGKWYTVFFKRILPFLLYIIPINIIITRSSDWFFSHFLRGVQNLFSDLRSPYFLVMWSLFLLVFLVILILLPRFATVLEFIYGILYFIIAIKFHYFNAIGIILFIALVIYLLFKILFIVVNIMFDVTYGDEKAERGKSGRKLHHADSDFFFGE